MLTRFLSSKYKSEYDSLVRHPVQSWAWGDFAQSQGHQVFRFGVFKNKKMVSAYLVCFHRLPYTCYTIGTCLRGPQINQQMIDTVTALASQQKAIFVKFEPDVYYQNLTAPAPSPLNPKPHFVHLVVSAKNAFYPHSHIIDLTKSSDDLLASMHPKTRYNIRLAHRYGVSVKEKTDDNGFKTYLKILFATTRRQGFYLHTPKYHQDLWSILKKTSIPHILIAYYRRRPLAALMLFAFKNRLFYPYGGSLNLYRQVMAPHLLMWQAIKLGQKLKLKSFDMWGSLPPNTLPQHPSFGFHRFKAGFGGDLIEFVGSWDLVINPFLYRFYNYANQLRWKLLRLKFKLPFK